ncbi:MAG TPA: tetratricopeptide repeat protein [Thermoanaerobaculia bacterium]|nr:tetratricopeptide repeat protein [Thermoanaerobaculia bacterium]
MKPTNALRANPARARWLPLLGGFVAVGLALAPLLLATTPADSLRHAIEVQQTLVAQRPMDGSTWSDLGNLLVLDGDRAGAELAYKGALRLAPDSFDANYNMGVLLLGDGRIAAALKHLRRASQLDPASAWARYHIGAGLAHQGKRADAIRAYAEAFRLDPRLAFPDLNPGVIDNPLLTESLLMAHRNTEVRDGNPRVYAEPNRIASLLVPRRSPSEASPIPSAGAEQSTELAAETRSPSREAVIPVEPTTEGGVTGLEQGTFVDPRDSARPSTDERQLRLVAPEDDGDPALFQAPAASSAPRGAASALPGASPAASRRRLGPGDLSESGVFNQAEPPTGDPGARAPGTPAGPVTRFRPGRRSTGQLDVLLLPRGAAASPAGGNAATTATTGLR